MNTIKNWKQKWHKTGKGISHVSKYAGGFANSTFLCKYKRESYTLRQNLRKILLYMIYKSTSDFVNVYLNQIFGFI